MLAYVYPKVKVVQYKTAYLSQEPYTVTEAFTLLRKKHTDGKWYLIGVRKDQHSQAGKETDPVDFLDFINSFHREVYAQSVLGRIVPDLMDTEGYVAYEEDEDQREETERLQKTLYPWKTLNTSPSSAPSSE